MSRGTIRVGTSGWHYEHWRGSVYPAGLPAEQMLSWYADHFRVGEINNSFYQLPGRETLEHWRDTVPNGFVFAVKASRYLTHMKKLKDAGEPLATFLDRIAVLGDRLGPILFQLPPRWHCNMERLHLFLEQLPEAFRYAFEFRDPSWFTPEVYAALEEKGAAFCIFDLAGLAAPKQVTADFVYVRLHGPGEAYQGRYDTRTLSGWAGALTSWAAQGREVFCFFDNDQAGYAAQNALELQGMVLRD